MYPPAKKAIKAMTSMAAGQINFAGIEDLF
jgi:hypothetical protein